MPGLASDQWIIGEARVECGVLDDHDLAGRQLDGVGAEGLVTGR
jgi:hypothetical protein